MIPLEPTTGYSPGSIFVRGKSYPMKSMSNRSWNEILKRITVKYLAALVGLTVDGVRYYIARFRKEGILCCEYGGAKSEK